LSSMHHRYQHRASITGVRWKEFKAGVRAATARIRKSLDMAVGSTDPTLLARESQQADQRPPLRAKRSVLSSTKPPVASCQV
jgi:hypothetical protein